MKLERIFFYLNVILSADRAEAVQPLDVSNPWNTDSYRGLSGEWDFNWYHRNKTLYR